jgi:hypothetical protein
MSTPTILAKLTEHCGKFLQPDGTLLYEQDYLFMGIHWEVDKNGRVWFKDQGYLGESIGESKPYPNNLAVIAQVIEVLAKLTFEKQQAQQQAKLLLERIRSGLNKVEVRRVD